MSTKNITGEHFLAARGKCFRASLENVDSVADEKEKNERREEKRERRRESGVMFFNFCRSNSEVIKNYHSRAPVESLDSIVSTDNTAPFNENFSVFQYISDREIHQFVKFLPLYFRSDYLFRMFVLEEFRPLSRKITAADQQPPFSLT